MTRQTASGTLGDMFAPYCPACRSRKLLPVTHIVSTDWETGGGIQVRCYCGTVIDAEARPPTAESRRGLRRAC